MLEGESLLPHSLRFFRWGGNVWQYPFSCTPTFFCLLPPPQDTPQSSGIIMGIVQRELTRFTQFLCESLCVTSIWVWNFASFKIVFVLLMGFVTGFCLCKWNDWLLAKARLSPNAAEKFLLSWNKTFFKIYDSFKSVNPSRCINCCDSLLLRVTQAQERKSFFS